MKEPQLNKNFNFRNSFGFPQRGHVNLDPDMRQSNKNDTMSRDVKQLTTMMKDLATMKLEERKKYNFETSRKFTGMKIRIDQLTDLKKQNFQK